MKAPSKFLDTMQAPINSKWEAEAVQNLEKEFESFETNNEKLGFLSRVLSDYNENHTFGQYDPTVVIDEETESMREEMLNFLDEKLKETVNDMK